MKARQGKTTQGKARHVKERQGHASQGNTREGRAIHVKAREGKSSQGKARLVKTDYARQETKET